MEDKRVTDLLFAYLNLFGAPPIPNFNWIKETAGISLVEWANVAKEMTVQEQIDTVQSKLVECLDDEFYRYHSNPNFKTGLTFDHDIQSWKGSTGRKLRFTISYTPPETYIIENIEDELNGKWPFGFDLPHQLGEPTVGRNRDSPFWKTFGQDS